MLNMKIAVSFFKDLEIYAHEKGLDPKDTLKIMEDAIKDAIILTYKIPNIIVHINKNDNSIVIFKKMKVVNNVRNHLTEINVDMARNTHSKVNIGDFIDFPCDFPSMERLLVRKIRDIFLKKISSLEREIQYQFFKNKVGEIITCQVKSMEFGNIIVDINQGTGLLRKEELINGEELRMYERVKVAISRVMRRDSGFQVLLSRTNNEFLLGLFKINVPEIHDGSIEIKSVARIPGKRAKVAVSSRELRLEPIGPCVGPEGQRIKAISAELKGERIDVVLWSSDKVTFVVNALSPAEVSKLVVHDQNITAVVPNDQVNIAIGVGGANIRLACKLTNNNIKIVSESDYNQQNAEKINKIIDDFIRALSIDEFMARFLVTEGFMSFSDIINASIDEIASLDGFDSDIAQELHSRAKNFLIEECYKLNVNEDLIKYEKLDLGLVLILAQKGVKSLEELAGLDIYELSEFIDSPMFTAETAGDIIIDVRKRLGWFDE
ncbi:transcription termination factor NusA [Candidatus Gromoviella agglomerans]|uniref:transcription termination factor NusA n=1 Tax=Candidatus Gromoviella agglomerans TaxID=2806609 RepID=UPI001E637489|nr:transcription termination factor NusA [Candidatus Gromoviella agglomerans]UFX98162.1 Transcription termination/antitermination protein NusA [Candidatus Gromoviella agglomerans]